MRSSIGGMRVEEVMREAAVVLQRIVDAHRRGRVGHLRERLVVLLQLLQRVQQA